MRTRRQITQSCGTAFAETPDLLGGRLSAPLEVGRGLAQAEFPLQHSFCHLLSTVNSQSSMMMVVHSVSWFAFASQHQLPSSRPDGQQPIETSHLAPEATRSSCRAIYEKYLIGNFFRHRLCLQE